MKNNESMKKIIKTIEYQTRTNENKVWHRGFTQKRKAIRWRNRTWPTINVVRVTTIVEVVDKGKVIS